MRETNSEYRKGLTTTKITIIKPQAKGKTTMIIKRTLKYRVLTNNLMPRFLPLATEWCHSLRQRKGQKRSDL